MISKAIILGRVGRKESKALPQGATLIILSVETIRVWTDKNGNPCESKSWHHVNCFSTIGEIAQKNVKVGDTVYIDGEINNKRVENGSNEQWLYSITANLLKVVSNKDTTSKDLNFQCAILDSEDFVPQYGPQQHEKKERKKGASGH